MSRLSAIAAAWLLSCAACAPVPQIQAGAQTPVAGQACGDLLAEIGKKPAGARFVGCSAAPERQGKPLRAVYEVAGRDAAVAEAYLVDAVGLERLKRACCQWDAPPRSFRDARGRDFSITMASGETLVSSRERWGDIPVFEIAVDLFTEEI